MIAVPVDPAAVVQADFKSRRDTQQVITVINFNEYSLAGLRRLVELAGANGKQHVEIGITLGDMRIEDAESKGRSGHDIFIGSKSCFGLHDVGMGAVGQDFFFP